MGDEIYRNHLSQEREFWNRVENLRTVLRHLSEQTLLSERIRKSNAIIQHIMSTNKQNQLWVGLMEYSREHGVSTFKGVRVGVSEFTQWAMEHLGMMEKDIEVILAALLKREIITYSAKGKDEIVVTPRAGVALPGG